jgi:hypothetical protein
VNEVDAAEEVGVGGGVGRRVLFKAKPVNDTHVSSSSYVIIHVFKAQPVNEVDADN